MNAKVFLITPPFTQLNTPYPATAYLKGFLNTRNISSHQADLGIEATLVIFSRAGLTDVFRKASLHFTDTANTDANLARMLALRDDYIHTIDDVIRFLQGRNPTLAHTIVKGGFLPEASRFGESANLDHAFGAMGIQDRARYLATMYLEDLADLIKCLVDPHFGFSRYAERMGRSARSFDELHKALQEELTFTDHILLHTLAGHMAAVQPALVAISVPFPGNLYAAFRCAQWIRRHYPQTRVAMGGGFPNTELRSLTDVRVFDFFHFITLDDGEAPLECLIDMIEGRTGISSLKRTFVAEDGKVIYHNNTSCHDYRQGQVGIPDYTGLPLDSYISAIEVMNPMHSLWTDGCWLKLTMAHGCYWGKCTFCDTSLDYIQRYEPNTAAAICDRMEAMMAQTGRNGFHFVDEAAPPALMRDLALEIIRRRLIVTWWTNIRFEKSFTRDLCFLLRASGCIAVSGGLEVASDRLLALIQKGITVGQVARVNKHFAEAGIMVHAYLMYGFPTQTAQETIDSLEMVRQMFLAGILQSAYWHQFAMTAHSPVGISPATFKVALAGETAGSFANNDLEHTDPSGADHSLYAEGLKTSLLNYMHQAGLDLPLHKWFDFKVPRTTITPGHIVSAIEAEEYRAARPDARVVWLGHNPDIDIRQKSKGGQVWDVAALTFHSTRADETIRVDKDKGLWLADLLPRLSVYGPPYWTLQQVRSSYEAAGLEDFELFWENKPVNTLYRCGLLQL